jgi:hypothetical protein
MQRKPSTRTLAVGFLAASAALSVAVLAARNLYDDEISSFYLITQPLGAIIRAQSQGDVHPPGMYLLAHLAYCIVPSFRWINLFPLVFFYAGLSFFVLSLAPIFPRKRSQVCFFLLATLHPELLMWSNTFRWYSWWTGLALITLVLSLQPHVSRPRLTKARALSIGLLLGCLFYLNYITLLFAATLATAMFFRFRNQPRRQLATPALLTLLVFAVLIAPQLDTMVTVHLPGSGDQRSSVIVSVARLLLSLTTSEAFLPWQPLAVAAVAAFMALCVNAIATRFRRSPPMEVPRLQTTPPAPTEGDRLSLSQVPSSGEALFSILLFALLFLVLVTISGLGGKPRNGLLLIPLLAPAAAFAIGVLRPRLQIATLVFFSIWSAVGVTHLLGRYDLTKATMNDRPEQVIAFIRQTAGSDCPLVVTYDVGLSFALSQSRLPGLILVSGTGDPIFLSGPPQLTAKCQHIRLYAVRSYLPSIPGWINPLDGEAQSSTNFIEGQARNDYFSPDFEAHMKRRFAHLAGAKRDLADAAHLPDYRYAVTSGPIAPETLPALLKAMPDYTSSSDPTMSGSLAKP